MEKIKTDFNEDLDYRRKKTINPKKREAMLNWETEIFVDFCRKNISEETRQLITKDSYSEILEELLDKYTDIIDILEIKSFIDYYGIFQANFDYFKINDEPLNNDKITNEDVNYQILFKTLIKIDMNSKKLNYSFFQSKEEQTFQVCASPFGLEQIIDTMIDLTIIPSSQETDNSFTFDVQHLNLEHYEMENLNYLLKQRNELKKIEMICDENSFLQSLTIDKNKTSLNNVEFENLIHEIISQILYDREELAKHYKKEQEEEESNT